ncbi:MAG: sigma-70 family RNA polymerase sigma factor [Sedimentisphaerales bacterium]|nr:sigma-70 family RNA polymerase sigma factor [Sedimentisphaerales bacterium]
MMNTDKSLIEAHCKGDQKAFGEIVRRYGDSVLGYLIKMTGDKEHAEDLFQETFKRVHEKSHTFKGKEFKSWLFKIATNVTYDGFRKKQRTQSKGLNVNFYNENGEDLVSTAAADNSFNPSVATVKAEQVEQVRQAIESLPDRQKAALVMAYYQQLSYREVALAMDCSIGTVKTQMYRALKTLAQKLPEVEL